MGVAIQVEKGHSVEQEEITLTVKQMKRLGPSRQKKVLICLIVFAAEAVSWRQVTQQIQGNNWSCKLSYTNICTCKAFKTNDANSETEVHINKSVVFQWKYPSTV